MYKKKTTLIIAAILCLLPMLIGIYYWNELPDMMATHWNIHNQPDRYSSKTFTVFGMPLLMVGILFLCSFATKMDPKKPQYNEKIMSLLIWFVPVLSIACSMLTYGWALGHELDIGFWIPIIIGLLFVFIGNYLPKCPPSYTMGIKLPWTLSDDENWRQTHRMAGPIWVAGGIVMMASAVLKLPWLMMIAIVAMILIPSVYSYLYFKKNN